MEQEYFIMETNDEDIWEVYSLNNDEDDEDDGEPWFVGSKIDCEEWILNRGQLNIYYK